ncbi:MAG: DegT/DnrJ/EryC1/StrS aminotransferase [candidate division WS6 bacterium GW2011_GWF2_39_15]|uniref:DegT/DnrJ/EryC1/StrS aminotransferase n=1 Tax=candidate division WS6 bacterium GW2011_GWF2_39_15 TaxID=1619100 RepID=A0A0G0Q7I3_9BACT|nr:MAG: DegT/DnrJ/EryC1/StrS aminotransferase [candidate division WS6 bacterium GW2011_GWF2_39_15]
MEKYHCKKVYLFSNARSAEYVFLKSLNLPLNSEVLVQAFTCNAVINPILWLKHTPVYIDIKSDTFNMDPESLRNRMGEDAKVLIIQHTFGKEAQTDDLASLAKEKDLLVLEDCAHSLGNKELGVSGDAAIVSFGIEKILSTRVGGALLVNNEKLISNLDKEYSGIRQMPFIEVFLWLLNPILWRALRKLGLLQTPLALLLNKIGVLNMGFYRSETKGLKPRQYARRLPDALSRVVNDQLEGISENLNHRREISDIYSSALNVPQFKSVSAVRFPLIIKDMQVLDRVKKALYHKDIYIGDWYHPLIYPASTNIESMGYRWGECPVAEDSSRHVINLPTGKGITKEGALEIAKSILSVMKSV